MNEMSKIQPDTAVPVKSAAGRWTWMLSVPLLIVAVALYVWLTSGKTVSTDNAMVGAPVVTVAPEITGKIIEVAVAENQHVQLGDLLFRIDPEPFRIEMMQADAALGSARVSINEMSGTASSKFADSASKAAMVGAKSSGVALARENFDRQAALLKRGFTTRARVDEAQSALVSARAAEAAAQADRQSAVAAALAARARLGSGGEGTQPMVASAQAMRAKAQLELSRTEIRAPIAGIVTQTDRLQPGNMATQMLPVMSVVGTSGYWIEANFKETQLAKIRIGQSAEVEIDAVPGRTFRARVSGIGAGTGSEFSLLPAQNATGNWVKVTQRVPVRLTLLEKPDRPLVAGWSARVTVTVAH
jgi:membrane fusion protein, multidrug efflux system